MKLYLGIPYFLFRIYRHLPSWLEGRSSCSISLGPRNRRLPDGLAVPLGTLRQARVDRRLWEC